MDEKRKEELRLRLIQSGHNGIDLTPAKYAKLDAIDKAAVLMIERRAKARKEFHNNELTGTNIERVLKELGGETITDQTLNKTDLYHNFIRTYENSEGLQDLKEQVKKLRQEVDEAKVSLSLLYDRDAECQEAKMELESLRKRNKELEDDKADLMLRLSKLKKGHAQVNIETIDYQTKTDNNMKS